MAIDRSFPNAMTGIEFDRFARCGAFRGARVELRRGLIRTWSTQHVRQARAKSLLANALDAATEAACLSWVAYQAVSVAFGGDFRPMPDILVWDPASVPSDFDGPIPASAVRLIVEVSDSTLSDDVGEKLEDYAGAGVAEYWVVDVKGRQILQHVRPTAGTYAERIPFAFGATIASRAYPSLRVDTATLL